MGFIKGEFNKEDKEIKRQCDDYYIPTISQQDITFLNPKSGNGWAYTTIQSRKFDVETV